VRLRAGDQLATGVPGLLGLVFLVWITEVTERSD
jgi:hypothetical protein